jgi:hypothetical protein
MLLKVSAMDESDLRAQLGDLFRSQLLAVLATQGPDGPYASLVAFASSEDLRYLIFATSRSTRKFAKLSADARAAMLIDRRSNQLSDFCNAVAVTVLGEVEEVAGKDRTAIESLYLAKHPHLAGFLGSENCALMRLLVKKYIFVSNFQQVVEMDLDEAGSSHK